MLHQEFESPDELKDGIKCFWYNRMELGEMSTDFEVMPDGYAEIIFYFGSACSVSNGGLLQALPSPFLMGLLNQPVVLNAKDRLEVIGIRCYPWTVFDLLDLPAAKGGVSEFVHPIAGLQSKLKDVIEAGRVEDAIDIVKQYFLSSQSAGRPDITLNKAGVAMLDANGALPVSKVAAAAHATIRTLERKFKYSSGHSVKDVSGLMRFEQARNRLWADPEISLAGLAQELGYADQSHFSKEFKKHSGTAPGAFARKARKRKSASLYPIHLVNQPGDE